jgi:hypothetical protein
MDFFQRIRLFADADVFDRLFGDAVYRQRRAAAGVAVHLRQHHAGDVKRLVEALGDLHRVLSGHAVGN